MKGIYHKLHASRLLKGGVWLTFFVYIGYALNLLIFGSFYRVHDGVRRFNLIPFKTIFNYIDEEVYYTPMIIFNNLAGNVLVFMPLGFLLAVLFKKMRSWRRIIGVSFLCTLAVECTQYILAVGTFDVDDILLNTIGGGVGYLCFIVVVRFFGEVKNEKNEKLSG